MTLKPFAWLTKYVLTPAGLILGGYMTFETWVISKAQTVVEPVKVQVIGMDKKLDDIAVRARNIERILMEREK